MVDKKVVEEAVEMTKNIPASDVLVPLQQEETDLTPYPRVEYDVLFDTNLNRLVKDVNRRLENGRYCDGGIQVATGMAGSRYYQAMERRVAESDSVAKPEMPSQNSEAGTIGHKALYIPGLENEPDLYEDIEPDAEQ